MNPYAKIVLSAIRVVAFGCVAVSLALWATDAYLFLMPRPGEAAPPLNPVRVALKGLPALAGLILFWKGKALALLCTKDLE